MAGDRKVPHQPAIEQAMTISGENRQGVIPAHSSSRGARRAKPTACILAQHVASVCSSSPGSDELLRIRTLLGGHDAVMAIPLWMSLPSGVRERGLKGIQAADGFFCASLRRRN